MKIESISFDEFLSHPDKKFENHIKNMIRQNDDEAQRLVKLFHDIAKLKIAFQIYIRNLDRKDLDKKHSFLSACIFLLNSPLSDLMTAFGFLAIVHHHGSIENFFNLIETNKNFGKYFENSKEFDYFDEVCANAKKLEIYQDIKTGKEELIEKATKLQGYVRRLKFQKDILGYNEFVDFKKLYSNLIYSDKFEAIFSRQQDIKCEYDLLRALENFINKLKPNAKRAEFRKFVLDNFDDRFRLFTLTAPTGYGKTLTALNFALKFKKDRIIYALPFTSIIDQTDAIFLDIYKEEDEVLIYKVHHKTTIDENEPADRYSKIKFMMESFSGDINITTIYQLIFAIFGNSNKDNVKFNQLQNSVVIIDEAQAIAYKFRKDFIKLCEIISDKLNTVFIFMSATMPIIKSDKFKEISNLDYFKNQNRYVIKWLELEDGQASLIKKVKDVADHKNTLVVVNEIAKAQELFMEFCHEYNCFCLNGYMYDEHKQSVISKIKEMIDKDEKKVLLISTQSIEAGVDLSFDVGFREISPISSIIQTAGRVNRHFKDTAAELYVFSAISKYTDKIYGDLQFVSKEIHSMLKEKDIQESEVLEMSSAYFSKIHDQLESLYFESHMQKLEFESINKEVEEVMSDKFKELIIIEPQDGFIRQIESEILKPQDEKADVFMIRDIFKNNIKKLSKFGINITHFDKDKISSYVKEIKGLRRMYYLPFGHSSVYSDKIGLKKDINLDALNEAFDV
ncbi:CRISPR-associated helicase Cas3' [Campylobacter sp.]|uniref:CRISPR-associated helicase Cas3' n=1 Tax=Campylobacter sp. TaxID=205 RepID=UPI0026FC528F|nr:CRISPR-associated helicase Cas3' [Campylobacter sp.]